MNKQKFSVWLLLGGMLSSCADDQPFLSGYIRRASDAIMTTCDPYNTGVSHTCLVYSSAFNKSLVIYDATVEKLVLSPMIFFPLRVKVGPLTDALSTVSSEDKKFPYFLALDPVLSSIFVVRSFPSGQARSLSTPLKIELPKYVNKPFKMAAWAGNDVVAVVLTYPDDGSIDILGLDKQSGKFDPQLHKRLSLGVKPSHVLIDPRKNAAIISDAGSTKLYEIDLSSIEEVFAGRKNVTPKELNIGMKSDRIYWSRRDFGQGEKSYVAALESMGSELRLINMSDYKLESNYSIGEHPTAVYFPDKLSEPCCGGEKNWLAVATVSGKLKHILIQDALGKITLKEKLETDLTSEKNLRLNQLTVMKILGGSVIVDPSNERELQCGPSNRKMFFVSSFAMDKPYVAGELLTEAKSLEVEAQGQSCEGDGTAFLFGASPSKRVAVTHNAE